MGLDVKFISSLLDCIDGKKSEEVILATKSQVKSLLSNGISDDDKKLLADLLQCMDKKVDKAFKNEVCNSTKKLVEEKTLIRNNAIKTKHENGTIGSGAALMT